MNSRIYQFATVLLACCFILNLSSCENALVEAPADPAQASLTSNVKKDKTDAIIGYFSKKESTIYALPGHEVEVTMALHAVDVKPGRYRIDRYDRKGKPMYSQEFKLQLTDLGSMQAAYAASKADDGPVAAAWKDGDGNHPGDGTPTEDGGFLFEGYKCEFNHGPSESKCNSDDWTTGPSYKYFTAGHSQCRNDKAKPTDTCTEYYEDYKWTVKYSDCCCNVYMAEWVTDVARACTP